MEKKKSIAKIAIISLISVLLVIFSIISFTPKNSVTGFAGFANAINKGLDVNGGIYATYTPEKIGDITDAEFKKDLNSTYLRIKSLINEKGYEDARVYLTSDNKIRIESPNSDDASSILTQIGEGELVIRTSSDSNAEIQVYGRQIINAFAMQDPTTYYWGTYIGLDDESAEKISELTKNASSSQVYLYFYRGNSENYFFSLPISSQIVNDFLFISSSTGSMTMDNAVDLAVSISTGCFDTIVKIDGDVNEISPSAGDEALLGLIISSSVTLFLILVIFAGIYRELGLMAIISILLFSGLTLFLAQSIPNIILSTASVGAFFLGLLLIASCHIILLQNIKSEYKMGKKLNNAIKSGYKKSISIISEICGGLAIIFTILYFICTESIKSFSLIMILCSILSIVITLFFTYHLNKSYSILNSSNGKRVNFTREEGIDEI